MAESEKGPCYATFYVDLEDAEFIGLATSWDEAKQFILDKNPSHETFDAITHWTQIQHLEEPKAPFVCAVLHDGYEFSVQYLIVECYAGKVLDFSLTLQSSVWQSDLVTDNLIPNGLIAD